MDNILDRYLKPGWRERAAEADAYWRKTFQGGRPPVQDKPAGRIKRSVRIPKRRRPI